jgi:hypothetical protein
VCEVGQQKMDYEHNDDDRATFGRGIEAKTRM